MGAFDDTLRAAQRQQELMNSIAIPRPAEIPTFSMPKMDGHLASGFYERLKEWIADFEAELDNDTEVGVRVVNFGQTLTFHLTDISYWNPFLIRFDGLDSDGKQVQLIQNVSQISVLLMRLPKLADEPRRIGFHRDDTDEAE